MILKLPTRIALTCLLTGTIASISAPRSYAQTTATIQPNSPICQGLGEYEATGKIDRVIQALDKEIASNDKFIDAYLYRGALVGLVKNDSKAAIADFDRILALDPNHVRARAYRALAEASSGNEQGLKELDLAIANAPNASAPRFVKYLATAGQSSADETRQLARIFDREGDRFSYFFILLTRGSKSLDNKGNQEPKLTTAKAYFDRGLTKFESMNLKGAIADFNETIKLDPKYPNAHLYRGATHLQLRQEASIEDLDRAITLDPQSSLPYLLRTLVAEGIELDKNGRVALSRDIDKIIELDPKSPIPYIFRSAARRSTFADIKGAMSDFSRAVTMLNPSCNPANSANKLANFETYLLVNQFFGTQARKEISAYDYHGMGRSKLRMGDYRSALADFDRAITIDAKNAFFYLDRAKIKANKMSDPRGALGDFDRAISLDRNSADAYLERAKLKASKLKDIAGARQDFDRAIANSKTADNYVERANFRHKYLKNKTGAIADYRQALKLYREVQNREGIDRTVSKLRSLGINQI